MQQRKRVGSDRGAAIGAQGELNCNDALLVVSLTLMTSWAC